MKRGQITLFIILGIIILIIVTAYLILRSAPEENVIEETLDFDNSVKAVETYAKGCIQDSAAASLLYFGFSGSRLDKPRYEYDRLTTTYLRDNTENRLQSLAEWESTLSSIFETSVKSLCNFSTLHNIEVQVSEPKADVKIKDTITTFNINYPINIISGDTSKQLDTFTVNLPVRLPLIHSTANTLIKDNLEHPDLITVSLLNDFDAEVTVSSLESNILLYTITDPTSDINDDNFVLLYLDRWNYEKINYYFYNNHA